jgi:Uma2 family endonuclease
MTLADIDLDAQDHIVLEDVSWEFYEQLLAKLDDEGRHLHVTYDNGRLEMMSPLPKHGRWESQIVRLVGDLCVERNIEFASGGDTTFRNKARRVGLEPDACFYFTNCDAFKNIDGAWDAKKHPAPDLVIEVEATRKSIAKQPIYAKLGIKELWRFDGKRLHVLVLDSEGNFQPSISSAVFPFLPMQDFEAFLHRFDKESDIAVIRAFRQWVRSLPQ